MFASGHMELAVHTPHLLRGCKRHAFSLQSLTFGLPV